MLQDDDKNVSPKETIDAIYKAGFKNVFVQYYRRDNLEFDELKQIDYCRQIGLNIIFCHLGYKNINEIWIAGEKGEKGDKGDKGDAGEQGALFANEREDLARDNDR